MAANAPYDHFIATPSSANAAPARCAHDEYDAAVAAVMSPNPPAYFARSASPTPAETPLHTMDESHNFAGLLEAATTAAGHAAHAMHAHEAVMSHTLAHGGAKRKRSSSPLEEDGAAETAQADRPIAPKRRRVDVPIHPQLQTGGTDMVDSPPENSSESPRSAARPAGVHSAAALFRRSSERTARKYTRPPMSKLFMSLQLSPENFLQLQSRAKTYMLDTAYPERQNCVGNRGKGDNDMVKLRLFNCVRDFLNDGVGEQFFGENVEKPGESDALEAARALGEDRAPSTEDRLTWPRDGNKIISLVTPLMRRMVTNERQRMYAIETRKGGAKKKGKEGSAEAAAQHSSPSPSGDRSRGPSIEQQIPGASPHLLLPLSPAVATSPSTPSQIPTANMMPTTSPGVAAITNINIFLVSASNTSSTGAVKQGAKLAESRLVSADPHQLANCSWPSFQSEVTKLLQRAEARFLTTRTEDKLGDDTNNLRDMAAAANAIQGNDADGDGSPHTGELQSPSNDAALTAQPSPLASNQADPGPAARLPQHIIKTVGPTGWEVIENDEQWRDLLLRRAHEIWADGVVNVVVELVYGLEDE